MVDEIDEIIPKTRKHTYKCPCEGCGGKVTVDIEWGADPDLDVALKPIVCPKCGTRLDK